MSDFPPPGSPQPLPPPPGSPPPPPPPAPGFGAAPSYQQPGYQPPPGYSPYGGAGGAHYPTQKIGSIAKWLIGLQIVSIAVSAISLIVTVAVSGKAKDFLEATISRDSFRNSLGVLVLMSLLVGAVAIASLVLSIVWTFRMAKNHQVVGRLPQSWAPGWGIGVWLLSCLLNILPYLMLMELSKASDPATPIGDPTWKQRKPLPIVHAWFWTSIAGLLVGFGLGVNGIFGGGFNQSIDDQAKNLGDRVALSGVSGAIGLVASILLVMVIRQLTARHKQLIGEA